MSALWALLACAVLVGGFTGLGSGVFLTALSANARVETAQAAARRAKREAAEQQAHCEQYHIGELEAVAEATRPDIQGLAAAVEAAAEAELSRWADLITVPLQDGAATSPTDKDGSC